MTSAITHRVVVLTPPGAGAIGVVRLIGPDSVSILNRAFRPASGGGLSPSQGDRLRYGHFVDGEEVIDDVIVSVTSMGSHEGNESHAATEPRSHEEKGDEGTKGRRDEEPNTVQSTIDNRQSTIHRGLVQATEDVAEQGPRWVVDICAHGGVRVIERILQTLERLGATVCEPAEAVELAWPTGSLIEHEALEAMTRAKTERVVRFLAWQREHLVDALEAVASLCRSDPAATRHRLAAIADGYPIARRLIEGVTVALVGPPNSGKSTLFNRLIGRPATVVSPQPGTTRDWVAEPVEMDGVPVTLVDTAGRWDSADALERQAVEAGRRAVERADLRVLLVDGSAPLSQAGLELLAAARAWPHCLVVLNKADAGSAWESWDVRTKSEELGETPLMISAVTGAGCDELVPAILAVLGYRGWVESVPCLFTPRQAEAAESVLSVLPHDPAAAEHRLKRYLIGRCAEVTSTEDGL
jgi:tRNA modification GTPase